MDIISRFLLESSNFSGYLYHYANKKFNILETLKKQKEIGNKSYKSDKIDRDDPLGRGLNYSEQISFFLEPIPIKKIREIMPENKIYNNTLYEHVIKIDDLEPDIKFQIVSAPFETLIMTFLIMTTKNLKLIKKIMKFYGNKTSILYKKQGIEKLKNIQQKYKGRTEIDFQNWFNSNLEGKIKARKTSYQAGVIHVKLYPISGEIKTNYIRKY